MAESLPVDLANHKMACFKIHNLVIIFIHTGISVQSGISINYKVNENNLQQVWNDEKKKKEKK